MGRLRILVPAVAVILLLTACSEDPDSADDLDSDQTTQLPQAPSPAPNSSTTTTASPISTSAAVRFDARHANDVFALVELGDGSLGAEFGSSLDLPTLLPGNTHAAMPDGRGGIVYTTKNQVWWQRDAASDPFVIEDPGIDVLMVGPRHIDGNPVVLVLIGDKLIGYDNGTKTVGYAFEEFSGNIVDLSVDGDLAVGIVADGNGSVAVELVSLSTEGHLQLVAPVSADDAAAPVRTAVSGDRVVVLRRALPVLVLASDGTEVGTVGLGIEEMPVSSVDLADDRLLVAFGEAATATDIHTGARVVVSTPAGWVLGAVWADPVDLATPPPLSEIRRFRVDDGKVEADIGDPYLNVRIGPMADAPLYAKLPPTYTGLLWTGSEETSEDGGVWYEVELLHPVRITPGEPLHGGTPIGWVNSAFLDPLPEGLAVTTEELPACADVDTTLPVPAGSRPPNHVYALESGYLSERCLRIVLTFGTGTAPFSMEDAPADLGPANALPQVREHMSGGSGVVVDLGGVRSVWWGATETGDGVYVVGDGENLQLWSPVPVQRSTVWGLNERGIIVVDLVVARDLETPPAASGVVLTRDPWAGWRSITAVGIARPFEANLGVRIESDTGDLVDAIYSGNSRQGTTRTSNYSVPTADWTEAWAPFAVEAAGLAPGNYTLVLDARAGRTLRIPVSIEEPDLGGLPDWLLPFTGDPSLATAVEQNAVLSLVEYARGSTAASSVPFADEVALGLNVVEQKTVTRTQLDKPRVWESDLDRFDGYVGPFSVLATLAHSDFIRITAGPVPHCAGPPLEWPAALTGLRQINIEPIGGDSCLQWFGVSVFLNAEEEIEAVVLDLYGP